MSKHVSAYVTTQMAGVYHTLYQRLETGQGVGAHKQRHYRGLSPRGLIASTGMLTSDLLLR